MYESFAKLYISTPSVKLRETKNEDKKQNKTDFRFKQFDTSLTRKMVTINVLDEESVPSQKTQGWG